MIVEEGGSMMEYGPGIVLILFLVWTVLSDLLRTPEKVTSDFAEPVWREEERND